MRVLLPVHQALAGGGVGVVARGLAESLPRALGPADELVVVPRSARPRAGRATLGRTTGRVGALARLGYEQLVLPPLARRADLVHLCDARPLMASRRPFLITVHDVSYLDNPEWFPGTAAAYKRTMLSAAIAKRPDAIACDSEHSRERLLAHHPRAADARLVVIPPGVDPVPPPPSGREPGTSQAPYFLTVSTIQPRKNHLVVLEAMRLARRSGFDLRWKIVGEAGFLGPPIVERLAADPDVDLLGAVSRDELERLYRGALFVATPSHAEGFGLPPLEAMARGVPTICSRGSALDETVGDASLRADPDDPAEWAEALLRLAGDSHERERLAGLGPARAARFDWSRAAAAFVECYREICA